MEGELCTACWTGNLQLHEGMLVCDVCGSIHQGFAEETQEYQTGISDARFFKKSEGMKAKAKDAAAAEAEPPPPPPVEAAVRAYVGALQQLLQRQAQVLIATLGMDPGLSGVLRQLWLAHLAHSRLLEPATILKLEVLAGPGGGAPAATDGSEGEDGGIDGGGSGGGAMPGQMTFGRRSLRIQAELAPALHPRHTLALLLLACWCQLEAAGPLDVLRWALDGRLPYVAFAAEEGAVLQQYRNILGGELIAVRGVPSPKALLLNASTMGKRLGLACPPLSPALWLARYLADLELSQELLPVALQLHALYQPAPLVPTEGERPGRHPWALLMASLVVAAKLCYGVGGGTRSMPGLPLPPEWADWAPRQLSRLGSAAQLDESQFRAYMQYLQRGLLADCGPPPDLETAHQLFQRMALVDGVGAGGVRQGGSAGSGARHALQREADRQQQQQQQQEQLQEHRAQQEQPPSHAYPFFGASVWHKHRGMLPADYVLLLTPCAALVWLVPEALHELVSGLEQAMIAAECEISFLYNSEDQARLWKCREEGCFR
ncbi:hypothetical protein CHLNCDRAFT_54966 [Chlorella variabilis]|uniref:Rrn7/TAF1B C-terminal cyclin domain-containing protein n=1 Tax=Chlorella variabilis TaxID=554065 RepID=E1ZR99_CHLVA|nr:hypothetical protein CHLNCDRAFT_54966 [Chlorella variabilis]EFN51697.1 hypothetical protein CHLNCDRAFT_54966 [Chlorella variabilis]|eukprot:XP_005843799.1 hypothetical protein CHLNCDRAFT_54966 [Chlorella variabilis]